MTKVLYGQPKCGVVLCTTQVKTKGGRFLIIPNLYKFVPQSTLAQPFSTPNQITDTYGWIYLSFGPPLLQAQNHHHYSRPKTQSQLRPHSPIETNKPTWPLGYPTLGLSRLLVCPKLGFLWNIVEATRRLGTMLVCEDWNSFSRLPVNLSITYKVLSSPELRCNTLYLPDITIFAKICLSTGRVVSRRSFIEKPTKMWVPSFIWKLWTEKTWS